MFSRLGYKLQIPHPNKDRGEHNIWLHALSVGEITSAIPLLEGIRKTWPNCRIIVTVTTTSGEKLARKLLDSTVDLILPSPLDIKFTVSRYIRMIQPDVYIHVETDFWPNLLLELKSQAIPSILVNGRISEKSLHSYKKFSFFFTPIFNSFTALCMQTEKDLNNMLEFGVPSTQINTLGNLKFDTPVLDKLPNQDLLSILPAGKRILTAGSTHPGEEEILLSMYVNLRSDYPDLHLVIVPRNPERALSIAEIAMSMGLRTRFRTENAASHDTDLLIIDTIGELIDVYRNSAIAFVGGSLVPTGGHNPIEPALFAIPVLFGPHMEDFSEIAATLIESGGGFTVSDSTSLNRIVKGFLDDDEKRIHAGNLGLQCVEKQRGVLDAHLTLIQSLL